LHIDLLDVLLSLFLWFTTFAFSDRYGCRYHPRGLGAARVLVHDQVLDLLTNRRELYAYFSKKDFIVFVFYLILSQVLKFLLACFAQRLLLFAQSVVSFLLLCLLSRQDPDR
jgi:hypothetical protein